MHHTDYFRSTREFLALEHYFKNNYNKSPINNDAIKVWNGILILPTRRTMLGGTWLRCQAWIQDSKFHDPCNSDYTPTYDMGQRQQCFKGTSYVSKSQPCASNRRSPRWTGQRRWLDREQWNKTAVHKPSMCITCHMLSHIAWSTCLSLGVMNQPEGYRPISCGRGANIGSQLPLQSVAQSTAYLSSSLNRIRPYISRLKECRKTWNFHSRSIYKEMATGVLAFALSFV
jgi:hypothetical protein